MKEKRRAKKLSLKSLFTLLLVILIIILTIIIFQKIISILLAPEAIPLQPILDRGINVYTNGMYLDVDKNPPSWYTEISVPYRITFTLSTDENGIPKPDNYLTMVRRYQAVSAEWRQAIRRFESETGRKYLFIPTFQAAYDDTNFPDRDGGSSMYPRTRSEMEHNAEVIKAGMGTIYDNIGPFVVYSELPEGAAVIESQCLPQTLDRPGRFVGCGTQRLQILKKNFSP